MLIPPDPAALHGYGYVIAQIAGHGGRRSRDDTPADETMGRLFVLRQEAGCDPSWAHDIDCSFDRQRMLLIRAATDRDCRVSIAEGESFSAVTAAALLRERPGTLIMLRAHRT
jgi:hypothetical protein